MLRQVGRRSRQTARIVRDAGVRGLANRAAGAAVKRLPRPDPVSPVRREDVLTADLTAPPRTVAMPLDPGGRMVLNWVMTPPGAGSGGHTTLFRIIAFLERQGHTCRIVLYDVYGGDSRYYERSIREQFPDVRAHVHDVDDGLEPAHAHFATSWPTAYPVYASAAPGLRCYLVQDYEPWFYAASAQAVLAENTYRMGLHAITAGRWLAEKLAADYGMATDHFDFGCDTTRYRLENRADRRGVVFYARPAAARRAYEIGVMTLELFARSHPDVQIHLYGQRVGRLPFRFADHGLIAPDDLNAIYNQCFAGLSLSMSNVSLVPHEMLASGCIPVVNDAEHNRVVLDNPFVRYAPPTPHALAGALSALASDPAIPFVAAAGSRSVEAVSWEDAGRQVESALMRAVPTA